MKMQNGFFSSQCWGNSEKTLPKLFVDGANSCPYKTIVFDMGNVLVLYDPPRTMAEDSLSQGQIDVLMKEVFLSPEWAAMDRGTMELKAAFSAFCSRLPDELWAYIKKKGLDRHWMEQMPPFEEMYDLVADLKDGGYGIYLLSNASAEFYDYSKNYPVMELMDGKIVSADHHYIKPEPEIYEILFDSFDINPREALFIDDMPQNIEAALKQGMDGICFSPSRCEVSLLRDLLKERGIVIK